MAPELFPEDERDLDQRFTLWSDVYAFGMLSFEVSPHSERRCHFLFISLSQMFTDEVPFKSLGAYSQFRIVACVQRGDRPSRASDTQQRISDNMWGLMRDCWVANPIARPTAAVIVQRIGQ